jgi:hypothetical protein
MGFVDFSMHAAGVVVWLLAGYRGVRCPARRIAVHLAGRWW